MLIEYYQFLNYQSVPSIMLSIILVSFHLVQTNGEFLVYKAMELLKKF